MALGGILAALAVVVMTLGGIISVATYVCPVVDILLLHVVLKICGQRIAWAWYAAVTILVLLLSPNKEAAAVFAFLGYYPILKPKMDRMKGKRLWKFLFFNGVILLMYWLLLNLFGMAQLAAEFRGMGIAMTAVTLILGNVTFALLDRALEMKPKRKR